MVEQEFELLPTKLSATWIFSKKELPSDMKQSYSNVSAYGNLILGMADYRTNTVFINLPLISNIEELIRTITHEILHIIIRTNREAILKMIL